MIINASVIITEENKNKIQQLLDAGISVENIVNNFINLNLKLS